MFDGLTIFLESWGKSFFICFEFISGNIDSFIGDFGYESSFNSSSFIFINY